MGFLPFAWTQWTVVLISQHLDLLELLTPHILQHLLTSILRDYIVSVTYVHAKATYTHNTHFFFTSSLSLDVIIFAKRSTPP